MRMRLDEAGDVGQILDRLARASLRRAPCLDLACEGVLERRDPKQDAMHVSRHGTGGELAIEALGAQLQAHRGASLEAHRRVVALRGEAGRLEQRHGSIDLLDRDHEVDVPGDHGLDGPVIDCDAADAAPVQFGAFKGVDHAHDVVGAAGSLPVVELPSGHACSLSVDRS